VRIRFAAGAGALSGVGQEISVKSFGRESRALLARDSRRKGRVAVAGGGTPYFLKGVSPPPAQIKV
jgi:hypothetical protein